MLSPSGHYATALFRAAKKINQLEKIFQDITVLSDLVTDDAFFAGFSGDPSLGNRVKQEWMEHVSSAKNFMPIMRDIISLLCLNGRLKLLQKVIKDFKILYYGEKKIVFVTIIFAHESESERFETIKNEVTRLFDPTQTLRFKIQVDPSLIGGFTVECDNRTIDFSVKRRLKDLNEIVDAVH